MAGNFKPPVAEKSPFLKTMRFDRSQVKTAKDDLFPCKSLSRTRHALSGIERSRSNVVNYDREVIIERYRPRKTAVECAVSPLVRNGDDGYTRNPRHDKSITPQSRFTGYSVKQTGWSMYTQDKTVQNQSAPTRPVRMNEVNQGNERSTLPGAPPPLLRRATTPSKAAQFPAKIADDRAIMAQQTNPDTADRRSPVGKPPVPQNVEMREHVPQNVEMREHSNRNSLNMKSRGTLASSREIQEGLKSILFWHVIGSYQNLNKLVINDENPDANITNLQLDTATSDLDVQSKTKPNDGFTSQVSLDNIPNCTCNNKQVAHPQINSIRNPICIRCSTDNVSHNPQNDNRNKSSGHTKANTPQPVSNTSNIHASDLDRYMNSGKLRELESAVKFLRASSIDDVSKQQMLGELDNALDYLVDMVSPRLFPNTPLDPNYHCQQDYQEDWGQGGDDQCEGHDLEDEPDLDTYVFVEDDSDTDTEEEENTVTSCGRENYTSSSLPKHPPEDTTSAEGEEEDTSYSGEGVPSLDCMRPSSFLLDEMDEFDRIFSELFFSPHKRMSSLAHDLIKHDSHNKSPGRGDQDGGVAVVKPGDWNVRVSPGRVEKVDESPKESTPNNNTVNSGAIKQGADVKKNSCDTNNVLNMQSVGSEVDKMDKQQPVTQSVKHSGRYSWDSKGARASSLESKQTHETRDKSNISSCACSPNKHCLSCIVSEPVQLRKKKPMSGVKSKHAYSLNETVSKTQARYSSPDFSLPSERTKYLQDSLKRLKQRLVGEDEGDKLFTSLLDDLDNITGLSTDSAKRRKRARDIFSEWLFHSEDSLRGPPPFPVECRSPASSDRSTSGLRSSSPTPTNSPQGSLKRGEIGRSSGRGEPGVVRHGASNIESSVASRGGDRGATDDTSGKTTTNELDIYSNRWRAAHGKKSEHDTDSGYHTGDGSLREKALRYRGHGGVAGAALHPQRLLTPPPKPPGEYTLTREDLRQQIESFNNNNHGLLMTQHSDNNTFQGFLRVHINLIRPINMSLSVRPPSLYEMLTHEDEHPPIAPPNPSPTEPDSAPTEIASFYLPKDTTKVIHIGSDTDTDEVIRRLLRKFQITDNPRKFALYEQIDDEVDGEETGRQGAVMRKLASDEQPLPLCLTWGSEGLATHRFILQENDSGDVIWEAFSVPELNNFLAILNREQEEYVDQIRAKYALMQVHINRRMQEIKKTRRQSDATQMNRVASDLTGKMAATKLVSDNRADFSSSPGASRKSAGPSQQRQEGRSHMKSDVHKDTPRPGQLIYNDDPSGREKSPLAGAYQEDEREPVFV